MDTEKPNGRLVVADSVDASETGPSRRDFWFKEAR
jgi:hypothetical protein